MPDAEELALLAAYPWPGNVRELAAASRDHIEAALRRCHGRVQGPFGAARLLDINPHTLRSKMRKLGIDARQYR